MEGSVIFTNFIFLILYGAALAASIFALVQKKWIWPSLLAASVVLLTSAYALLEGASPWEVIGLILFFMILNLIPFLRRKHEL